MTESTARLELPLLAAGQAQKEIVHNEALLRIDILTQPVVHSVGQTVPPSNPAIGQGWIVGNNATGAWFGRDNMIASWTAGGWRFVTPKPGFNFWSVADNAFFQFSPDNWSKGVPNAAEYRVEGVKVMGAQQSAIATPSGGTVVDPECRNAVAAILQALRSHGMIAN